MVSQRQSTGKSTSRARLLAAAEREFAARGFDGAKVDRITRRARVNKAMLYYHFRDKAALYRTILVDLFRGLAAAVAAGQHPEDLPEERIRRFVRAIAEVSVTHPHFPSIWLREMAEGGRHLDPAVFVELRRVLHELATILDAGRRTSQFRDVNPFLVQIGIVAPLLIFTVSAPVRERFRAIMPDAVAATPRQAVIDHVEAATLAALRARPTVQDRIPPRRSR